MSENVVVAGAPETPVPVTPDTGTEDHGLSEYVPETVRKPGEIVFGVLGVLFGILGWYFAMDMTSDTYSSPSVFPKMASALIIICGLVTLGKSIKRAAPAPEEDNAFRYLLPRDVLVMLLLLVAYCIVLPYLHFIPSSYIFMVAGMVYLHKGKNIVRCCLYSAIALLALVLVFRYLFLVILP